MPFHIVPRIAFGKGNLETILSDAHLVLQKAEKQAEKNVMKLKNMDNPVSTNVGLVCLNKQKPNIFATIFDCV